MLSPSQLVSVGFVLSLGWLVLVGLAYLICPIFSSELRSFRPNWVVEVAVRVHQVVFCWGGGLVQYGWMRMLMLIMREGRG